jgi:predicted membrane-bound dolichyl-phosphate-mannose-protein mannosyltransferase
MKVEIPNGDLVDKITILKIKLRMVTDKEKLKNIRKEYKTLKPLLKEIGMSERQKLFLELVHINQNLWSIEDELRKLESIKDFDKKFIELARQVYYTNDERSRIKKEINIKTKSELVEEKFYENYK